MNAAQINVTIYCSPFCGYCGAAKRLLDRKGIGYKELDVMFDPELRAEMVARSGRQTVPQVFVGEKHIGGFDDLTALDSRGELDKLFVDGSVPLSP
jgi:glutaredoxin 3